MIEQPTFLYTLPGSRTEVDAAAW